MSVPSIQPFVLREQYVRVNCDLKGKDGELAYDGLWIECRKNLTNGEREILIQLDEEISDELTEIGARYVEQGNVIDAERLTLAPDDKDGHERLNAATHALVKAQTREYKATARKRQELIVPHIRAWNLFTLDDDGNATPVPPPKDGGIAMLEEVTPDLVGWMLTMLLTAYRTGFGIGSARSVAPPQPMNVRDIDKPKGTTPRNSRRSPSRLVSPSA